MTKTFTSTARRAAGALLGCCALLSGTHAAFAADLSGHKAASQSAMAVTSKDITLDEGRKAAFFCANCHGDNGISKYPDVPNLAGQNPVYLRNQIEAFASGKRKNDFMQGLVKVLDERSRQAIVHFYASANVTPTVAPGPLAQRGAVLFAQNCARCHQADARGAESFPRLAGQQQDYLRINLKRYLTQSGERLYTPMTAAVTMLGEDNFEAVTQYLTSLK